MPILKKKSNNALAKEARRNSAKGKPRTREYYGPPKYPDDKEVEAKEEPDKSIPKSKDETDRSGSDFDKPDSNTESKKKSKDNKDTDKKDTDPKKISPGDNLDRLRDRYAFKRSLEKPKKTVKDFLFNDVLAAPQKSLIYGATTLTRGIGKGKYETPGNVMRNDWGWGDTWEERAAMQGADLVIDPLNAFTGGPTKAFQKTILTKPYQGLRTVTEAEARMNRFIKGVRRADKVADTDSNIDYIAKEAKIQREKDNKKVRDLIKGSKSILYKHK